MSQAERTPERSIDAVENLSPEDRAWLKNRLVEYQELLQYLHDH